MRGTLSLRQRLLLRNLGELLEKVKVGIEEGSIEKVRLALTQRSSLLGGARVTDTLIAVISGRLGDDLSHQDASARLERLADDVSENLSAEALAVLENLGQAIGCFVASGRFGDAASEKMARSKDFRNRFVSAMVRRDRDSAVAEWSATPRRQRDADIDHYLWFWTHGVAGEPHWSEEQPWTGSLRGSPVLILGPAPSSLRRDEVSAEVLIGRIIAPGVTSWPADDPAGGRCDLAWANSKSTKWFVAQDDTTVFDAFRFSSFRTSKWRTLAVDGGRDAVHHKALLPMPWDKTNMVPLAVWDLLQVPDVDVAVSGTTFFASRTAYTPHDVRFKQERGGVTDQAGSTGLRFERCLSFSHHALVAHLSMMANLATAGAVGFDAEAKAVLGLSAEEYREQLDQYYGIPGI